MRSYPGNAGEWKRLGFRCGLEIHHQVRTEKKLFCHCPAGRYSDEWHAEVLRHMRPTLSELGEYDGTALMEFKTKKEIIYRLNRETVCTYEMDDTPPFLINEQAIDIALTIALAFNCKIVGELHIIRKQYLDGSIPAGFQRTAIVGVDGELPLSNGKVVRVVQLGLEEDACREVSDVGHRIVFMADRLSMPLVEVVTDNTLATPEEAQEAAERISRLLRATQMVRRGAGSGRQDVNVSIDGSTRVEIKGVPKIPRIAALTAHEAYRQEALLALRDELRRRGFDGGDRPGRALEKNLAGLNFNRPELAGAGKAGDAVRAVVLPEAKDLLAWPLAGWRVFAQELAGRVRVVACLDQYPNLFHSDGPEGGLDEHDRRLIEREAGCGSRDVAVIVWGPPADAETAVNEILDRWAEVIDAIPNETRQAMRNNTTDFERILPGPDRMYPDTDSPPYAITDDRIERARVLVPEAPWERERRYREQGLPEDIVARLPISPHAPLHDWLVRAGAIEPVRSAEVLARVLIALRRRDVPVDTLSQDQLEDLLVALGDGRIHREGLFDLLPAWAERPGLSFAELLADLGWTFDSEQQRERVIEQAVQDALELARSEQPRDPDNLPRMAMGHAMDELRGRVAAKDVLARIVQTAEV